MKNRILTKIRLGRTAVLLVLFSAAAVLSSCQNDEPVLPDDPEAQVQRLQLNFSFDAGFENDTEYTPIEVRSQSEMLRVRNAYQYVILKELSNGDFMLIESSNSQCFDPDEWLGGQAQVHKNQKYTSELVTSLRPGTYKFIIFTIPNYTQFHQFDVGTIIPGPNNTTDPQPYAMTYTNAYLYAYVLPYEAFYASADFVVSKTTELQVPNTTTLNMTLERRCSKFRVAVEETAAADHPAVPYFTDMFQGYANVAVYLRLRSKSGGPLPWGLDMWGRLWYDPNPAPSVCDGHKYYDYFVYYRNILEVSPYTSKQYFVTSRQDVPSGTGFHFSEPGEEIEVVNEGMYFSSGTGALLAPRYLHSHDFKLKNNEITGLVVKLNDQTQKQQGFDVYDPLMDPVYESDGVTLLDPAKLFQGNYEDDYIGD